VELINKITMKKILLSLPLLALALVSCDGGKEESPEVVTKDTVEVAETTYSVDTEKSTLDFAGSEYKNGEMDHQRFGTLSFSNGSLTMKGEELTAAKFAVDMASLVIGDKNTELDSVKRGYLKSHLMNSDFFSSSEDSTKAPVRFTESTFEMASYTDGVATGTLTFLGMAQEVSFPVNVSKTEEGISATGDFAIDFESYNMPGMVAEEGDDEIKSPKIDFTVNLMAK
jgi:polyisoprenoid-binding protein YceI